MINIKRIIVTGRFSNTLKDIMNTKEPYVSDLNDKEIRFLHEEEVTEEDFIWADAFVSFRPTPVFNSKNLKWVHSLGAGVDCFLSEDLLSKDIILTRTDSSFGEKIAQYCLSYTLADLQFHSTFQNYKQNKSWTVEKPKSLKEQKVLVFGTGSIGQQVGQLFSSLGVTVYGVSLSGAAKEGFVKVASLDQTKELKEHFNIIINTLPLTADTRNLFNRNLLSKFNNALFINVGRGATVNEEALLIALNAGNLRLAVLDVFKEEPLPQTSELWEHPSVIITPHISALTDPLDAIDCFHKTLIIIEKGEFLPNKVDFNKGY